MLRFTLQFLDKNYTIEEGKPLVQSAKAEIFAALEAGNALIMKDVEMDGFGMAGFSAMVSLEERVGCGFCLES